MQITRAVQSFIKPVQLTMVRFFRGGTSRLFDLDLEYYCNPDNRQALEANLSRRNCEADLDQIYKLWRELKSTSDATVAEPIRHQLLRAVGRLPNTTHPDVLANTTNEPVTIEQVNEKPAFTFIPRRFEPLASKLGTLQSDANHHILCGERSYYLRGDLAMMEQALITFSMKKLLERGFVPVSVPDILHPSDIEACGMNTTGQRSQVYKLRTHWDTEACLSGTAEMALANMYRDECLDIAELPQKFAAVSRCYRAEISNIKAEKGMYRVHQFTKVEMFAICHPSQSDDLLTKFVCVQRELFDLLGLHFMIMDMPVCDLGRPAYRKFDIEAWMPGHKFYGEISSASNCTDYQGRRIGITYKTKEGQQQHVHTVNGTACAIPRMLIALCESHQEQNGAIGIPPALRPYMNGKAALEAPRMERTFRWLPYYYIENR
ncbi:serine--tRNA ligase, mitochondrial-like [Ornithodoros turicata]